MPRIDVSPDERLSREAAAKYLGVSVALLAQDACTNRHRIPYIKLGRRSIYLRSRLDEYLRAREVNIPTVTA